MIPFESRRRPAAALAGLPHALPLLQLRVHMLGSEMHKSPWLLSAYRRVDLAVMLSNEGAGLARDVTFEVLLPEGAVHDLAADSWQPSHRHEVEGRTYLAWSSWNTPGVGELMMAPRALVRRTLKVDLRAHAWSAMVLWRIFQRGVGFPLGKWGRQSLTIS